VYSLVGKLRRQLVLDELHVFRLRCWARQWRGSRVGPTWALASPNCSCREEKKIMGGQQALNHRSSSFSFFFFFFQNDIVFGEHFLN
jgi:hypothetical protein